jgi:hypothetical protein
MRLVAYASVSTERERWKGSLLEQQRVVQAWADREKHRMVASFADEAPADLDSFPEREGLGNALEALKHHKADALVIEHLDRLSPSLVLQELLMEEIERSGARVLSTDPEDAPALADPPQDARRALVREVVRTAPAYERARRDLNVRRRSRLRSGGGHDEAASLARIERLAEEGMGIHEISGALEREGFSPRFSHRWNPERLRRMVDRIARRGPTVETGEPAGN